MQGITDFTGRVAVVTGGASGIGKGIAVALIEQGAVVIIADIEQEQLDKNASEIGATGIRVDVSDLQSVESLADEVIRRFGHVDIVVNNAGIGFLKPVAQTTMNDWRWAINVNLWGVIHGVHVFLPLLQQNPAGGHIVNTASTGGLSVPRYLGAYSVTKFGVVALSEALMRELEGTSAGITAFCPGPVRSRIGEGERNRHEGAVSLMRTRLHKLH